MFKPCICDNFDVSNARFFTFTLKHVAKCQLNCETKIRQHL